MIQRKKGGGEKEGRRKGGGEKEEMGRGEEKRREGTNSWCSITSTSRYYVTNSSYSGTTLTF